MKKYGLVFLLGFLLSFSVFPLFISPVKAQPTITTLNLPQNYLPKSIVYYKGYIWAVSYTYGEVSKINISSGTITNYYANSNGMPDTNYTWQFRSLTVDSNGNFWLAGQKVVMFNPTTGTFPIKVNVVADGIFYSNGYVYFASNNTLYRYNIATNTYQTFTLQASGDYHGFTNDTSSNIWFSDVSNGYVYKFNGTTVTPYTGFHRPIGLAYAGGYIYVAENVRSGDNPSWTPAIAKLDPTSGAITRTTVAGSPYGVITFTISGITYIAYSSSGEDLSHTRGIGIISPLGTTFFNVNVPAVYNLVYNNNTIYFAFYDDDGVGSLSDPTSVTLLGSESNQATVQVNAQVNVTKVVYETSLTLEADKTTVYVGQNVTFTLTLRYANGSFAGQPVGAGKPVSLIISNWFNISQPTDANGQAIFIVPFTQPGTYTVKGIFQGGTFSPYESGSSSATLVIHVLPVEAPPTVPSTVILEVGIILLASLVLAGILNYYVWLKEKHKTEVKEK